MILLCRVTTPTFLYRFFDATYLILHKIYEVLLLCGSINQNFTVAAVAVVVIVGKGGKEEQEQQH